MAWRPIETAPKDGTKVLLYINSRFEGRRIVIAAWVHDPSLSIGYGWSSGEDLGWECETYLERDLTHWQPLPEPPTS